MSLLKAFLVDTFAGLVIDPESGGIAGLEFLLTYATAQ